MTHAAVDKEYREMLGITDSFVSFMIFFYLQGYHVICILLIYCLLCFLLVIVSCHSFIDLIVVAIIVRIAFTMVTCTVLSVDLEKMYIR